LETSELTLDLCTLAHVEQLIAGPADFEQTFGLRVIDGYLEEASTSALYYWHKQLDGQHAPDMWGTYLFIHRADQALIGLGGYKGAPNDGTVEIGYGVAPAYQGRGTPPKPPARWSMLPLPILLWAP
jgi:[ribosomal protein S5]-alanine N-acetyltransferase